MSAPGAVCVAAPAEGDGCVDGDEEKEGTEEQGVEERRGGDRGERGEDQDVAVFVVGCDEGEEGGDCCEGVRCGCAVVSGCAGGFGIVEVLGGASATWVGELDLLEAVVLDEIVGDGALAGADSWEMC